MKKKIRLCAIVAALLLLSGQSLAWAQGQPSYENTTVQKITITHVGPQAVNDDYIRSNIRIKPGDTYVRTVIDDSIKNLYSTGYFYNIRVIANALWIDNVYVDEWLEGDVSGMTGSGEGIGDEFELD